MRRGTRGPWSLIVLAEVLAGHESDLLDAIESLPNGSVSPFDGLDDTHFARFALIPALLGPDDEPLEPEIGLLLFSADIDSGLEPWAETAWARIGSRLAGVFRHCARFPDAPDAAAFTQFLNDHRVAAGFSISAYDATVAEVRASLSLRARVRRFAEEAQGLSPAELRAAWSHSFGGDRDAAASTTSRVAGTLRGSSG